MATISSSIISPTTYLHHHSSSKPFKPHLPISSKPNPNFSQSSSLRLQISPILSNPRQPTRLFCVAEETPAAVVTVDPTSEAARRLYVGNIPRTTTNDDLQKVFEEHGAVEKVEVMYDKYSGRSRRFGFVTMKTVDDANAAIEKLNDTEIGGRKIKVNVTEKPLTGVTSSLTQFDETPFADTPYKLYVGNLAKTVTSDSLKSFFAEKGNVVGAKVSRVPGTSKSSGFGFVSFSSEEEVEAAIPSFNDAVLEGQKIRVNKA
ncbi:putative RNA recognition motif domain, nucleotide-binding alpha-beta plait domain superfamily [Helianthus anomalus]